MAENPREMLNKLIGGMKEVGQTNSEQVDAWMNWLEAATKPGVIDKKTKELIGVAIAAYSRSEYSIVLRVNTALEAGATREEVMESAMVAAAFGGGPSLTSIVSLLKDSIDEFEGDFK